MANCQAILGRLLFVMRCIMKAPFEFFIFVYLSKMIYILEYRLIDLELDGSFETESTPVSRHVRPVTVFQHKAPLGTSCCAHSL